MSSATQGSSPINCCGLMYTSVPPVGLIETRLADSVIDAEIPKSVTFRSPARVTIRFAGFKSRWTIFALPCA